MTKPRLVIFVLAIYTVILGALAQMGAPVLAIIFYVALITQVIIHTVWLCPRCANMSCAINRHSPHYVFGAGDGKPGVGAKSMNTSVGVALLGITFLIGLAGVWYFSEVLWMFMFVLGIVFMYMYSRVACRTCGNKCFLSGEGRPA